MFVTQSSLCSKFVKFALLHNTECKKKCTSHQTTEAKTKSERIKEEREETNKIENPKRQNVGKKIRGRH